MSPTLPILPTRASRLRRAMVGFARTNACGLVLACLCGAMFTGCGEGGAVQPISVSRTIEDAGLDDIWTKAPPTSADRFASTFKQKSPAAGADPHGGNPHAADPHAGNGQAGPGSDDFEYTLPEGWVIKKASSRFVVIEFVPPSTGDAAPRCTLSTAGGGVVANINRWHRQLGLKLASSEDIMNFPRKPLLGGKALFVDLEGGSYQGMGPEGVIKDARMLALMLPIRDRAVFLKMVGTQAQMAPLEDGFLSLAESLQLKTPDAAARANSTTPKENEDAAAAGSSPRFTWDVPKEWKKLDAVRFGLATFAPTGDPKEGLCTISHFSGDVGGLNDNVTRWCKQVGAEPLTPEEVGALPLVDMLGHFAPLVSIGGAFKADGKEERIKNSKLSAVYCLRVDDTVVVKLVGNEAVVTAQHENFLSLVKSLKEVK